MLRERGLRAAGIDLSLGQLRARGVPGLVQADMRRLPLRTGLLMSMAEGEGEGFEVAARYGSDRRRWFTRYREPELIAVLAAAGFGIRNVRRHHAYRDWLSVHAAREPAGAHPRS
jgi:hypothetical protein